jgi:CheY-like chemotaxis protein
MEWRAGDRVWDAFADRAQLELALVNLIINARDAMPAGGTITVSAENQALDADNWAGLAPGDYVLLSIADTGTGISPKDLQNVLEPFFTTKDVGKGSGLGLSMVYGFAKQSNGAFRLESELGSGTTAELWLPRAPEGLAVGDSAAKDEPQRGPMRPLRVLLVDDHTDVRTTTRAVLEDLGHSVVEAANGADALRALKDGDFGLVISDYAMPHISGTEFLREARKIDPDVRALIITGYADADAISDRPPGVEVLLKPFGAGKLEAALVQICEPGVAG